MINVSRKLLLKVAMPNYAKSCLQLLFITSHGLATYKTIFREQYCLIFAITLDMRNETICTSTVETFQFVSETNVDCFIK